jgi:hypothetical protein
VGKRRTRITIETDEIVFARNFVRSSAWCPKCQSQTSVVTLTQAALLRHVNESTIQDWIRSGQVHMIETSDRGVLICITSLGAT